MVDSPVDPDVSKRLGMGERMTMTDDPKAAAPDETIGLLRQALDGDSAAFDELFGRHRAELHRAVARSLGPSLRNAG